MSSRKNGKGRPSIGKSSTWEGAWSLSRIDGEMISPLERLFWGGARGAAAAGAGAGATRCLGGIAVNTVKTTERRSLGCAWLYRCRSAPNAPLGMVGGIKVASGAAAGPGCQACRELRAAPVSVCQLLGWLALLGRLGRPKRDGPAAGKARHARAGRRQRRRQHTPSSAEMCTVIHDVASWCFHCVGRGWQTPPKQGLEPVFK